MLPELTRWALLRMLLYLLLFIS